MALSNIFNEPLREIVETIIGTVVVVVSVAVLLVFNYWGAMLCAPAGASAADIVLYMIGWFLFTLGAGALFILVAGYVHGIGEGVCDALDKRGIHLRPRKRVDVRR